MAWHTEYGQALHQSAHLSTVAGLHASLDATRDVLLAGDPVGLLEAFPDGVRIDDQRMGRVEGRAALEDYCRSSSAWMAERQARGRLIASTAGASRVVGEFELELVEGERAFALPVAVVVEPDRASRSVWVRVYHSQWPLLGHHVVRSPLLERDPAVRESDVVGDYQRALAAGDAEAIVRTFEPDGCFREPAGDTYRVCGTDALGPFFARFFSAGGGIILEHCTVTEDTVRTALEFNAVRWGGVDLPHQAGVAVYERGVTGRIAAARIYDDVEGPVESMDRIER
jgi:SnoaL-like domain